MDELIKEILEKSKTKAEEYLDQRKIKGEVEIILFPEENEGTLKVFIPKLPKSLQSKTQRRLNQIVTRTSKECSNKNFRNFYEARSRIGTLISIGVSK